MLPDPIENDGGQGEQQTEDVQSEPEQRIFGGEVESDNENAGAGELASKILDAVDDAESKDLQDFADEELDGELSKLKKEGGVVQNSVVLQ